MIPKLVVIFALLPLAFEAMLIVISARSDIEIGDDRR